MGRMLHHAIIVTSRDEYTKKAHDEAVRLCGVEYVTPMSPVVVNGIQSFLVTPDGSKEGWPESDEGDKRRAAFVAWLHRQRYDDGSSPYNWVLVEYGEYYEGHGAAVVDHMGTVETGDDYHGPHDLSEEFQRV